MFLTGAVAGLLGGAGGAAGATAAAAGTHALYGGAVAAGSAAASTAGTGLSIASILQGVAGVGSVVASLAAGRAEADSLKLQAADAEQEKTLEVLQSAERKRGLLASAQDALGEMDVANAASGVDLSFGSARAARTATYRQADIALNSDSATTTSRLNRLTERASNYYRMAKNARKMSGLQALTRGFSVAASLAEQV